MTLREKIEAELTRVFLAKRERRLVEEQADAVIALLAEANPKEIEEMIR